MGKNVYAVPIAGTPTPGDGEGPMHPAVVHSADPSNYCQHYRWNEDPSTVYIASDVRIPTLADHDDVTVLDPDDQDLSEYHTPSELAEMRGEPVTEADGSDEDEESEETDESDEEQPFEDDDSSEEESSEDETEASSDEDDDSGEEESSEEDGE